MTYFRIERLSKKFALATAIMTLGCGAVQAQDHEFGTRLIVTTRDVVAAKASTNWRAHFFPTRELRGKIAPALLSVGGKPAAPIKPRSLLVPNPALPDNPPFYPADVGFDNLIPNAPVTVPTATQQNIFVNSTCTPPKRCWGDPGKFAKDLNNSTFIHITDQYVSATGNLRYPVLPNMVASVSLSFNATDTDMQAIVIAAVNAAGGAADYTHMYHVFLPNGQQVCGPSGIGCYPGSFCAYHGSFDSGGKHMLYTVEPYQKVLGCEEDSAVPGHTILQDSTGNTLSHEMFETITDPDPNSGSGWFITDGIGKNGLLAGLEIGDICAAKFFVHVIGSQSYRTQFEYSNLSHACNIVP